MAQRTFAGGPSSGLISMARSEPVAMPRELRPAPTVWSAAGHTELAGWLREPVARAYHYLNFVMDAYAQGGTPRLMQSYNNESGLLTTAFVYDNALAVIAYLSHPTPDHVRRAKVLGDSLLLAQAGDVAGDGRIRQAYLAGPIVTNGVFSPGFLSDDAAVPASVFAFTGTSTGDAAWVGLALVRLYAHTRESRYLDGAAAIGDFLCGTAISPHRLGGFSGGVAADGVTQHQWASTEHNIDVYALFESLARLSERACWRDEAARARAFVRAMWQPRGHFFATGTRADAPDDVNESVIPLDVQAWSYLALGEYAFSRSLDWASAKLANADTSSSANNELPAGYAISGVTFSDRSKVVSGPVPGGVTNNDRDAVWLEGTAQLAAALRFRQSRSRHGEGSGLGELSDRAQAARYLAACVSAQASLGAVAQSLGERRPQTVGLTARRDGALCSNGALCSDPAGGTVTGTALPPRSGLVAASSAFDTGFGFGYFQHQHVGATSWFLLAAQGVNPFWV